MGKIPNLVETPNRHDHEYTDSEWSGSRMVTIPNGYDTKCTRSQMDTILNGQSFDLTVKQIGII